MDHGTPGLVLNRRPGFEDPENVHKVTVKDITQITSTHLIPCTPLPVLPLSKEHLEHANPKRFI